MQVIGIGLVLLARHHSLAPRAPASKPALILPRQPLNRLVTLVFVHLYALADSSVLLVLHFEHATNALDFLSKVARPSPPLWRLWCVVASILGSKCLKRLCLAGLVLDNSSTETANASAALDTLLAFASACAYTTQVVTVTGTPAPATDVVCVGVLQVFPTWCTEPDYIVAGAWRSFKRRCSEGSGRFVAPED